MEKTKLIASYLVIAIVFAAIGTGVGRWTAPKPPAVSQWAGETLIVGTWSGPYGEYFEEAVVTPFEEETGATVELKYAWDFTPEIIAAPADEPPLDVAIAEAAQYLHGMIEELWLPLRYNNIPNAEDVWPNLEEYLSTEYGVPYDAAPHCIVYRKDLIDFTPTNWSDLWRPEFSAKEICLEVWFPYWVYIGAYLSAAEPADQEIYSEEGRDAILETLATINERVLFWYEGGAEFYAALDAGDILIGNYWFGTATARRLEEPEKYGVYVPEEGAGAYLDYWCVVRGTDKRDLAEHFINYAINAEAETRFTSMQFNFMANMKTGIPAATADYYPNTVEKWGKISLLDVEYLEPLRTELADRFKKEVLVP